MINKCVNECESAKNSRLVGFGCFIPKKVLSNSDLEKMVDTNDEWIVNRTGIEERHISEENVYTSDLATEAAFEAIKNANITPEDIELIIVATVTPDYYTPSVSCIVQKKYKRKKRSSFRC